MKWGYQMSIELRVCLVLVTIRYLTSLIFSTVRPAHDNLIRWIQLEASEQTMKSSITEKKIFINLYRIFFFSLISVSGSVSFGVMIRIIDTTVFSIVFPNVIALILLRKAIKRNLPK